MGSDTTVARRANERWSNTELGRVARCHVRVDGSQPATYAPTGQVTGSSLGPYSGGATGNPRMSIPDDRSFADYYVEFLHNDRALDDVLTLTSSAPGNPRAPAAVC